ncbi:MAG: hypothetical protein GY696_02840, partial [Gammaproteobacteria bacterium]|nr:hypothetical protein [Gammaproteobacteria bacterium]
MGMPRIPRMSTTDIPNIVCTSDGVDMNTLHPGIHRVMFKCTVLALTWSQEEVTTVVGQQGIIIISTIIILLLLMMNSDQVQLMPTCHRLMLNTVGSGQRQQLPGGPKAQPILSSHTIIDIND